MLATYVVKIDCKAQHALVDGFKGWLLRKRQDCTCTEIQSFPIAGHKLSNIAVFKNDKLTDYILKTSHIELDVANSDIVLIRSYYEKYIN